jgi:hypothetical protein
MLDLPLTGINEHASTPAIDQPLGLKTGFEGKITYSYATRRPPQY